MPIEIKVKMNAQTMADFMVYHIFTSKAGMLAMALGVLNMGFTVAFAMQKKYLFMFIFFTFAILILVGFPKFIRKKVNVQFENSKKLKAPITYIFDEEGIETITEDGRGKASWKKFSRAVSKKQLIVLYDATRQAIVLPVEQLGDCYTAIVDLIFAQMPNRAVTIHRIDKKR